MEMDVDAPGVIVHARRNVALSIGGRSVATSTDDLRSGADGPTAISRQPGSMITANDGWLRRSRLARPRRRRFCRVPETSQTTLARQASDAALDNARDPSIDGGNL
jgi:hypothetical protein